MLMRAVRVHGTGIKQRRSLLTWRSLHLKRRRQSKSSQKVGEARQKVMRSMDTDWNAWQLCTRSLTFPSAQTSLKPCDYLCQHMLCQSWKQEKCSGSSSWQQATPCRIRNRFHSSSMQSSICTVQRIHPCTRLYMTQERECVMMANKTRKGEIRL